MERAGLTTQSIKSDVMTFLADFGGHQSFRLQKNFSEVTLQKGGGLRKRASLLTRHTAFDRMLLDSLCSAARDFLKGLHVSRPAMTHADTTCSCSTSWETSIFNTFGPYCTLQVSSTGVSLTALGIYMYVESDTAQLLDK